ncbi:uncharacterized protein RSE6_04876 [Rhynchosporium secalis]|uniref:SET domain-containing protein n=1 Tax=Rhynchosporium secalis TaxID=38038 RepID=A0A1E1M6G4_RHYSE|nr:uncharacterized protein RSE6_04876 [Rhynchosporium secalis]
MFPIITEDPGPYLLQPAGLAEDFEKWMEVRKLWAWYRPREYKIIVKRVEGQGGFQKLPDSSARQKSSLRNEYLRNPPSLSPSSSNSSILSHRSDETPPSSSSTSPEAWSSPSFSAHTLLHRPLYSSSSSSSSPLIGVSSTAAPPIETTYSSPHSLFCTEYFEVRRSKKGGYGAFARKDIEKGTVVMTEKSLFRANFLEVFFELEKLTKEQRREYRTLHGHMALSDSRELAIYKTNRFETSGSKGGIFIKSSRFNHACHPWATCSYRYDESIDTLIFTACNPIKRGEEITISYTSNPSQLMDNYGFYCDCPKCPGPKIAANQAKRLRGPF